MTMSINNLEEKLSNDLKEAMRSRSQIKLDSIRSIITALKIEKALPGQTGEFTHIQEISVLQRLKKQRNESLEIFKSQNREDLAIIEKEQLEIISRYLPLMIEGIELEKILKEIITDLNVSGIQNFGKVMAHSINLLAGKAEGKIIAATLKKLLI